MHIDDTTATEADLLAGIRAAPDDDLPRLAAADWYEGKAGLVDCGCKWAAIGERQIVGNSTVYHEFSLVVPEYRHDPLTRHFIHRRCDGTGSVSNGFAERGEFIRLQIEIAKRSVPDAVMKRLGEIWQESAAWGWWPDLPSGWRLACWHTWDSRRMRLDPQVGSGPAQSSCESVAIVRRGFLDQVRCPLSSLIGSPCVACQGAGSIPIPEEERLYSPRPMNFVTRCQRCRGLGHVGGVIDLLIRQSALAHVALTDKSPYWNGAGYCWFNAGRRNPRQTVPDRANLPPVLFDGLLRYRKRYFYGGRFVTTAESDRYIGFKNDHDATDCLSAYLIDAAERRVREADANR